MNSLFDENAQPEEEKSNADLTLGIGSLLSIFFGVVLICGIFFGFGYSMGRRATHGAAATTPIVPQTPTAEPPSETASKAPDSDAAGDSEGAQAKNASAAVADPSAGTAPTGKQKEAPTHDPAREETEPAPTPKATKVVAESDAATASLTAAPAPHRPQQQAKPHAGITNPPKMPETDTQPTPGHPVMVQIAAVSRQEDAEVLAGALRKRGFSPRVHGGTTDKFFHVQVGPFTDKATAESMKQHLLADGYNAILK